MAIAFAVGYLGHLAGDGFAHTFVNTWARGVFDVGEGDGLYGSATEEMKHLAIEDFLDHALPKSSPEELRIDAPHGFLRSVFLGPVLSLASDRARDKTMHLIDWAGGAASGDNPDVPTGWRERDRPPGRGGGPLL